MKTMKIIRAESEKATVSFRLKQLETRIAALEAAGNEEPSCPACTAEDVTLLGTLGTVEHYRCRACGMVFPMTKVAWAILRHGLQAFSGKAPK